MIEFILPLMMVTCLLICSFSGYPVFLVLGGIGVLLVAVNLQASFLKPPFGYALFYIKGVAPPEIKISTIYRGIIPFVVLQLIGLALLILWPNLILWIPDAVFGN